MESFFEHLPRSILWESELKTLNSVELMLAASDLEDTAKQSHPVKLRKLGLLYAIGGTLRKNPARAFALFKRAANLGDKNSAFYVGMALREGFGVTKNLPESFAWLRTASSKNLDEAFFELGNAFENGWGCKIDIEEAQALYRKAATLGNHKALKKLIDVAIEHPSKFKTGLKWLELASDQGMPDAMLAQARRILVSDPENWKKALAILQEACAKQNDVAMAELAVFWNEGKFTQSDPVAAFVYAYLAAGHGNYVCEGWIEQWRNQLLDEQLQEATQIVALPSRMEIFEYLAERGTNLINESPQKNDAPMV